MTRIVLYLLGLCLILSCLNTAAFGARIHSPDPEPLNLRDFGALGDGVTDDGPAFQSALDALAAAGGGTLFVPEGKYAIATPVAKDFTGLASSITILGVESLTPVAPPSAGGYELSKGLDLHSEVYPRTGEQHDAIFIKGLSSLVVKDIAFVGTSTVVTDAATGNILTRWKEDSDVRGIAFTQDGKKLANADHKRLRCFAPNARAKALRTACN